MASSKRHDISHILVFLKVLLSLISAILQLPARVGSGSKYRQVSYFQPIATAKFIYNSNKHDHIASSVNKKNPQVYNLRILRYYKFKSFLFLESV